MYGAFLIEYTMEIGWDEMIRCELHPLCYDYLHLLRHYILGMSPNLKGFLNNLDSVSYITIFIDRQ